MFKILSLAFAIFSLGSVGSAEAHAFQRIITLAPVLSEWTEELLGSAQTEKSIIAVSEYSIYPSALKSKPTIGAYFKLDIEKIAALKPDLIIASSEYNRPEQLEQLKRLNLPVQVLAREKFTEMPAWIKALGKILNSPKAAERASTRWQNEVKSLSAKKKMPHESLFLEIQHVPLVTIGSDSFLNDAFSTIGYENIFLDLPQAYPKVSKESVLKKNPEIIFILDLTGNPKDFESALQEWKKFGKPVRTIPGDDFARCSFALLAGLRKL